MFLNIIMYVENIYTFNSLNILSQRIRIFSNHKP